MGQPRNTTGKGYFTVQGKEPLAKRTIAVRLPESVDTQLRQKVGGDLSDWVRKAIIEKWEEEKDKPCERGIVIEECSQSIQLESS